MLSPISWPLAKWIIDLIEPLPKGKDSVIFAIVTIDYFTKWVEVESLAKNTKLTLPHSYRRTLFVGLGSSIQSI